MAPFPPMLISLEVLQAIILIYTHRQMSAAASTEGSLLGQKLLTGLWCSLLVFGALLGISEVATFAHSASLMRNGPAFVAFHAIS